MYKNSIDFEPVLGYGLLVKFKHGAFAITICCKWGLDHYVGRGFVATFQEWDKTPTVSVFNDSYWNVGPKQVRQNTQTKWQPSAMRVP